MIAETRIVGNKPRWVALWVALLFAFFAESWGTCTSVNYNVQTYFSNSCVGGGACSAEGCDNRTSCEAAKESAVCPERVEINGEIYIDIVPSTPNLYSGGSYLWGCSNNTCYSSGATVGWMGNCIARKRCTENCEAQKAECQLQGGIWVDSVGYGECDGYCKKGCDTTELHAVKVQCEQEGGISELEMNETTCQIAGFCNMCEAENAKRQYQEYVESLKKKCCEVGALPPEVEYKCLADGINSLYKRPSWKEGGNTCNYTFEVTVGPNGQTNVQEACGGSSSSEAGSSSSAESSSSECFGLDCSSSSEGFGSSGSYGEGPTDWRDSLHKIIVNTGSIDSNTNVMMTYLYDIATCLQAGTCGGGEPIDYTDSLGEIHETLESVDDRLRELNNKDWSVDFSGGFTAEKYEGLIGAINKNGDSTAKYGDTLRAHIDSVKNQILASIDTASKYGQLTVDGLNGIIDGLNELGVDTLAHRLDSIRNGYLEGIDSTYRHWGDSSNWKSDTSGWGRGGDSAQKVTDSVLTASDFFGSIGCDTTGGNRCDSKLIGSHGLDSAKKQTERVYGELRDSLTNGAFADSLRNWGSKFTGGDALSGSGSNSCPAILSRTYRVDIYQNAGYDFTLGRYLCQPFIGNITAWSLCRVLLRATIALMCMWFLFRCATGFSGGGGDND